MEENEDNQEDIQNENNIDNQNQENNYIPNENEENLENNNNYINNQNENEENIENNNYINNENQNEIQNGNYNDNENQENFINNNQQNFQNIQNNNQQIQQNNQIINNNNNGQMQPNPNPNPQHVVNAPNEAAQRRNNEAQKTVDIIKSKIKDLRNNFNFSLQLYDIITKIIKNFQDLTYEKLANTINECSNYFSFFKNSSELYSKFAEQIHTSNSSIMSSLKVPKLGDNFLLGVMQKTQNLLFQNLSSISNGLKQNIISKGPLSQLQDKINKIDFIKKMNTNKFREVEEQKKQLIKKFHKYDKLFESYLPETNLNNPNHNNHERRIERPSLVDTPDFVFIVHNLLEIINKLIVDINLFIVDTKDCFYKINVLYVEMNNLVRDSVLIYIRESKKVFNIDVAKNFEEIENYYKNIQKNKQDKIFKLTQIFSTNKSQEDMHTLLQQYYVLLCNSGRVKKEYLSDRNTFSIGQYSNLLLFFEWLISISPQPTGLSSEDLVMKRFKVKRDPGIFKGWRDSIFVFTRQHHLLLYDTSEKIENFAKIFEVDKTNFRRKLDNKRPFMFELIAVRKGKVMDFKGNYLFDALSEKNLNEIHPMILSAIGA